MQEHINGVAPGGGMAPPKEPLAPQKIKVKYIVSMEVGVGRAPPTEGLALCWPLQFPDPSYETGIMLYSSVYGPYLLDIVCMYNNLTKISFCLLQQVNHNLDKEQVIYLQCLDW